MELFWKMLVASCVTLLLLPNSVAYSRDTGEGRRVESWNLKDSLRRSRNETPSTGVVPESENRLRAGGKKVSKRMAQWNIFAKFNNFPFQREPTEKQEPRDPTTTTTTILPTTQKRKNPRKTVSGQRSPKLQENATETIAHQEEERDLSETENMVSKEQTENILESTTLPLATDPSLQHVTTTTKEILTNHEHQSTEETKTSTPYVSPSTAINITSTLEKVPKVTSTTSRVSSTSTSPPPGFDTTVAPDMTNISKCIDVNCSNYFISYNTKVKPHRLKVTVGSSVKLECQTSAENASLFRVLWFKKNETHEVRSELLESDNWMLAIESTKLWHSGTYHCVLQPRDGCCFVERGGVGVLGVYEKPNYYKHLLYIAALGALLLCFCVATVVFNYKRVKRMDAETESPEEKETVWLL